MKINFPKSILPALIVAGFLFQSCGNIDIVKRRYRPGFHVDVTKKKHDKGQSSSEVRLDEPKVATVSVKIPEAESNQQSIEPINEKNQPVFTALSNKKSSKKTRTIDEVNDFMLTPFHEAKREKLNGELRRAVFNKDDEEKYGWSVTSFISTGLGILALGMLITGIVLFAAFILGSTFAFWWLFLAIGLLLGIGAMVTGILGMRQTGRGERKGRGFAITGLVAGIMSLAGGLIALFWGLIYSIINGGDGDAF